MLERPLFISSSFFVCTPRFLGIPSDTIKFETNQFYETIVAHALSTDNMNIPQTVENGFQLKSSCLGIVSYEFFALSVTKVLFEM